MTAYRKLNVTLYLQLYPIKKVHKINFLGYFVSLCVIKDLYNGQTSRKNMLVLNMQDVSIAKIERYLYYERMYCIRCLKSQ